MRADSADIPLDTPVFRGRGKVTRTAIGELKG